MPRIYNLSGRAPLAAVAGQRMARSNRVKPWQFLASESIRFRFEPGVIMAENQRDHSVRLEH
jgi:hypothetical protein